MAAARSSELLSSPIGLQFLDLISVHRPEQLSDDELTEMLLQATSAASRFQGEYEQYVAALKERAPLLRHQAEWLVQRMAHGWEGLDRSRQVWVTTSSHEAEASRMVLDHSAYSAEVSKPRRAFWTSTFNSAVVSPWLEWLRFGEDQKPGPYYVWNVGASATARVFEIHSPASWAALVRAYPSAQHAYRYTAQRGPEVVRPEGSARVDPDWSSVAKDWDAVHLSVGGLLTAEDVPYRSGGVTTELRGWDMESTAWFRWSFSGAVLTNRLER